MARKKKSGTAPGFDGLGGNSFQDDIATGLGKTSPGSEAPQGNYERTQGYSGLGGNSFQSDMASGLGKGPPKGVHSNPTQLPGSFEGFGNVPAQNDISTGFQVGRIDKTMSPDWNKKRVRKKNILDEWVEHAESGGSL